MKYPLENATVWGLIRHPFDEESGDPGGRTFMRVLSNIFFPIYVFLQLWVPIQFTLNVCLDSGQTEPNVEQVEQVEQHAEPSVGQAEPHVEQMIPIGQQEEPMWLTVMGVLTCWLLSCVGFWTLWVIMVVFVRYFTSIYFNRQLIVLYYRALCLCSKKGTPNNIKWNDRLDEAMTNLDIVKAEIAGKEFPLGNLINPLVDANLIENGIRLYMESLNGKYNGDNIAKLFVTLCKNRMLATDTLAHFYRALSAQYTDGTWVVQNVVQKAARTLNAQDESEIVWQKEIMQKYFPQIKLDETKDR